MMATESHVILLLRPSGCFVATIYPFKPSKRCRVWWLQRKGCLCVSVSSRHGSFCLLCHEAFPTETGAFHRGLMPNPTDSFSRGRQSSRREAAPHRPSTLSPPQLGASSSVAAPRPGLGALQDSRQSHPPPAPPCHGRRGTFLAPPCLFALCGVSKRDACLLHASNIHSDAAL